MFSQSLPLPSRFHLASSSYTPSPGGSRRATWPLLSPQESPFSVARQGHQWPQPPRGLQLLFSGPLSIPSSAHVVLTGAAQACLPGLPWAFIAPFSVIVMAEHVVGAKTTRISLFL